MDRADGKGFVPTSPTTPRRTTKTAPAYRATPTKWTYRAIYRVGDHQVSQWSADASITVGG